MVLYISFILHQTATQATDHSLRGWLYISFILHQTATTNANKTPQAGCISPLSYIKPQLSFNIDVAPKVVYLLYPTSNRNLCFFLMFCKSCISPLSYIKPQLKTREEAMKAGCISPLSYIKPQLPRAAHPSTRVVYLLYPTSNRNRSTGGSRFRWLYISFILHQTATRDVLTWQRMGCISPLSYIKPQRKHRIERMLAVVYLLYPTSNRNLTCCQQVLPTLYISFILHQTATKRFRVQLGESLYISFILHQTATLVVSVSQRTSCISPLSYIKPQLL